MRALADLRTDLRVRLGVSTVLHTDAELDEALNNALFESSERAKHLNELKTVKLKGGQVYYSIPGDFLGVPYRAWHNNPEEDIDITTLEQLEEEMPRWWEISSSFPHAVFFVGIGIVGVFPVPSATGGLLHLEGPRCARKLENETDFPEILEDYEADLFNFALFWLKLASEDEEFILGLSYVQLFGDRMGGSPQRPDKFDSMRMRASKRYRDNLRGKGRL